MNDAFFERSFKYNFFEKRQKSLKNIDRIEINILIYDNSVKFSVFLKSDTLTEISIFLFFKGLVNFVHNFNFKD
jgi:hypothetical protein